MSTRSIIHFLCGIVVCTSLPVNAGEQPDVHEVRTHWDLSRNVTAHRVSSTREQKVGTASTDQPDIVDAVAIKLGNNTAWSREHTVGGGWAEIYGTIPARDSDRLVVYDAHLEASKLWVLYTVDQRVTLDYLTQADDAAFVLQKEYLVIKQHNSGINPYLIDSGVVFLVGDTIHVGLRVHETTASLRKNESPYDFFAIQDGLLVQITDEGQLWRLGVEHRHKLDDPNRPTLTSQITRPAPSPDGSAASAENDEPTPADTEP